MSQEFEVFGMKSQQIRDLFALSVQDEMDLPTEENLDTKKAEVLQQFLLQPLPRDLNETKALPSMLKHMCETLPALESQSLEEVLLNGRTAVSLLEWTKEYGKRLSTQVPEEQYEFADIIYHAVIASALVFHEKKISSFSYEALAKDFSQLTVKAWIPREFRQLFHQAVRVCAKYLD